MPTPLGRCPEDRAHAPGPTSGCDISRHRPRRAAGAGDQPGLPVQRPGAAERGAHLRLHHRRRHDALPGARGTDQSRPEAPPYGLGAERRRAHRGLRHDGRGLRHPDLGAGDQPVPHTHPSLLLRHPGERLGRPGPSPHTGLAGTPGPRRGALLLRGAPCGAGDTVERVGRAHAVVGERHARRLPPHGLHHGHPAPPLGGAGAARLPSDPAPPRDASRRRRPRGAAHLQEPPPVGRLRLPLHAADAPRSAPLLLLHPPGGDLLRPDPALPQQRAAALLRQLRDHRPQLLPQSAGRLLGLVLPPPGTLPDRHLPRRGLRAPRPARVVDRILSRPLPPGHGGDHRAGGRHPVDGPRSSRARTALGPPLAA